MLYHSIWLIYNVVHFRSPLAWFWIAMSLWGIWRAYRWHQRRNYGTSQRKGR